MTWIASGSLYSGSLASKVPMSSAARPLVSTIASLQYSTPVHAIVLRRNGDGS